MPEGSHYAWRKTSARWPKFELRHRDSTADPLRLRSLDTVPNTLPIQLTSFVGRHAELAPSTRSCPPSGW
jgi:hypothetical protein